jgi:hypothetical protein
MSQNIPPNNPKHPRWLLDLKEWRIKDFRDIQDEVRQIGYGIVSYTWGMWADWGKSPENPPDGLMWKVPYITVLDLKDARRVMESMEARYVWWDWMCVPQGNSTTLKRELLQAKGEEVGKQMWVLSRQTSYLDDRLTSADIGQYIKEPRRVSCGFIEHIGPRIPHWKHC